ncbi:MAG: agmatinase family protein [Cytophagales bacterium]|nr:agmatinase family protein [Cytophagales bacterium]
MSSFLKKKLIKRFDPNGIGQTGKLFGLPFDQDTSEIVVIPVPWDVTASFKDGASLGPKAVLRVSSQIDLFMERIPDAWKLGICMLPIDDEWISKNNQARKFAVEYIKFLEGEKIELTDEYIDIILKNINVLSERINDWVYGKSTELIEAGKIPVVLGGDHSAPYGLIKAVSQQYDNFGVLQIDAHADLRPSYEGFRYSHASIMYNVLKLEGVSGLVQVGIRDYCEQEHTMIKEDSRIFTFFDSALARERYEGKTWGEQVDRIIAILPDNIYVTIDVDGLEHIYSLGTGTPVPGGLSYNQLVYLLERIMESGKKIISFDICEVCGDSRDWDAIVGSRLLYNLANITAVTQKLLDHH